MKWMRIKNSNLSVAIWVEVRFICKRWMTRSVICLMCSSTLNTFSQQEIEKERLLTNLHQVCVRCSRHNLKLQLKKCRFFLQELPCLSHVIGQGTLKPGLNKIAAIVKMPDPSCPTDLIPLLAILTYLENFCLNLGGLTRPLQDLLKAVDAWVW
jgi:hypothetical protein